MESWAALWGSLDLSPGRKQGPPVHSPIIMSLLFRFVSAKILLSGLSFLPHLSLDFCFRSHPCELPGPDRAIVIDEETAAERPHDF